MKPAAIGDLRDGPLGSVLNVSYMTRSLDSDPGPRVAAGSCVCPFPCVPRPPPRVCSGQRGMLFGSGKGTGVGGMAALVKAGVGFLFLFLKEVFSMLTFYVVFFFIFFSFKRIGISRVVIVFFLGLTNRCLFCIQHSFIFLRDDHLAFGGVGTEGRV